MSILDSKSKKKKIEYREKKIEKREKRKEDRELPFINRDAGLLLYHKLRLFDWNHRLLLHFH